MFTSVCNFLYDTFFHRREIKFLRRKHDSKESLFGKRLKLSDCFWHSNTPPGQHSSSSFSMQKDDADCSDDEECCIIAEMPRRKTAGSSINLDKEGAATSKNSCKFNNWPSLSFSKDLSQKHNKEIQEIKCVNNLSGKREAEKSYTKNKFFNNVRSPLSQGKVAKCKISFRNHLRKRLNFLQESYRLTEKHQYMQLLQSQSLFNFQSEKSPPKSIKHRTGCIPVIDLTDEKTIGIEDQSKSDSESQISEDQDVQIVGEFAGVRSFQDILKIRPINSKETLERILYRDSKNTSSELSIKELSDHTISLLDDEDEDEDEYENQKSNFNSLEEKLKNFVKITCPTNQEINDFKKDYLPELTKEQEVKIINALVPEPKQEILAKGFGLQITRHDMQTLKGLNWLNDVVIDFYMNLIVERSKLNNALPKVYAFNTFFYPKLVTCGYDGLKRWTKQVDIFSYDMILVPIHLGMHWCLSIIDFRSKSVRYYDSVGSPNNKCLESLLLYLRAESLCKKKTVLHTSNWQKYNVRDIPQQMNGSDCGVFSCMFAEYISRDCSITFSQDDMPYFRKKIVIEILEKQLLT